MYWSGMLCGTIVLGVIVKPEIGTNEFSKFV